MKVSIIVHNFNRASALQACLRSVAEQTYRPLQVVIVDAGSTDESAETIQRAVASLRERNIDALAEECPRMGVAASRNYAARRATGDYLCFLDNDATFADDHAVSAAADALRQDERLAIVAFRIFLRDTGRPDPSAWVFRRPLAKWFDRRFSTFIFAGGGCCIRAKAFWTCGGFWDHLNYAREEEEMGMALIHFNWKISYLPCSSIKHYPDQHGRSSLSQRRHIELRNGLLVMWRRLPLVVAIPAMASRVVTMCLRAYFTEHQELRGLFVSVAEAFVEWKHHRLQRVPMSVGSAFRYWALHRVR